MILASDVKITDALLLAVVAMAIIMAVLACIMGLIYLMTYTFKLSDKLSPKLKAKLDEIFKKKSNSTEATVQPETVSEAKATAPGSCGELVLKNVSDKEAAMIMAIVADTMQAPLNELRFKSITLLNNDEAKENING